MSKAVLIVSERPRCILCYSGYPIQRLTLPDQHKSSLPLQSVSDLRCKYDFSKVRVHLVSSLSGKFEGWPEVVRVGHPRLMKVVMDIGAKPRPGWEVALECQVS